MLTIALSKGRIFAETLPILERAGIIIDAEALASRKLILETNDPNIKVLILRASDVPVFVEHGVADLGITGLDVLEEAGNHGLYELLDLNIAQCRLCLATPNNADINKTPLKVATKYRQIAERYFAKEKKTVEIIKLYGSIEIAPLVGLADCIIDLVATGNTLKENELRIVDEIMPVTSRLFVSSASYKTQHNAVKTLLKKLEQAL